jgi:hypothetical protein
LGFADWRFVGWRFATWRFATALRPPGDAGFAFGVF